MGSARRQGLPGDTGLQPRGTAVALGPGALDGAPDVQPLARCLFPCPQIREQNRQDVKSAGPQSQLLASVIAEKSRSPVQQKPPLPGGEACSPSGPSVPEAGQRDP